MDAKHKIVLNRCMVDFVENLNPDEVIPYLISREIMSPSDYESINGLDTMRAKVISFVTTLQRKGPNAFHHFTEALLQQRNYDHLSSKLEECLDSAEREVEMNEQWQWIQMEKYQKYALDDCQNLLERELPFEAVCEHFLRVGLLKKENINFMKELPEPSSRRSVFVAFVKGKGVLAYDLLLDFLQSTNPQLRQKILVTEEKIKNKEEQFQTLITFTLKQKRIQEYTGVPANLNVILIGKTGSGKSATGNTITGEDSFLEVVGTSAGTKTVRKKTTRVHNFEIDVLDTPGLFDTSTTLSNEDIILEIMKTAQEFSQGIHLFLFVCRADVRFTDEEQNAFGEIQRTFGNDLLRHCLLVVTHAGEFVGTTSFKTLLESNTMLNYVYQKTSRRALAVENNERNSPKERDEEREQVIHAMIETIHCNHGQAYSSSLLVTAKEELEKENHRTNLYEKIAELTFRFVIFELPKQHLSVIKNVLERDFRLNDRHVGMILAELGATEKLSVLKIDSLIQTFVEDQKKFIGDLVEYKESGLQAGGYASWLLRWLIGTERKSPADIIIPYVLQWFQNMSEPFCNLMKEGNPIPEHDIENLVSGLPPDEGTHTNEQQSDLMRKFIEMVCKAFQRNTQRAELLHCIRSKCKSIARIYFTEKTYKQRTYEINSFFKKGLIPPELHCRCMRAIPSKFKSESWYCTVDKLLKYTLTDRLHTENLVFSKLLAILGSTVFLSWIFPTSLIGVTYATGVLMSQIAGEAVSLPLLLQVSIFRYTDCNDCGGRHPDKRMTALLQ